MAEERADVAYWVTFVYSLVASVSLGAWTGKPSAMLFAWFTFGVVRELFWRAK